MNKYINICDNRWTLNSKCQHISCLEFFCCLLKEFFCCLLKQIISSGYFEVFELLTACYCWSCFFFVSFFGVLRMAVSSQTRTISYYNTAESHSHYVCDGEDPNRNYDNLVDTFIEIVDKHAPLKTKLLRGNEALFMNKELRKAIYTTSRLKNKWNKNPTFENRAKYKRQRNKMCKFEQKSY